MFSDYIETLFDDFIELHGDRYFADDHAIMAGIGWLNGTPVTVIGYRKGRTIEQNMDANFGMANPEGYRKALHAPCAPGGKVPPPSHQFCGYLGRIPGRGRGGARAGARRSPAAFMSLSS